VLALTREKEGASLSREWGTGVDERLGNRKIPEGVREIGGLRKTGGEAVYRRENCETQESGERHDAFLSLGRRKKRALQLLLPEEKNLGLY